MNNLIDRYRKYSRRRYRRAMRGHQRLDIQGLRMVAVLTVVSCHLWAWPRGGFVGVDVFFVISGFLITGNLLRMVEVRGNVSFRLFYWNRVRRIVPAATTVLIAICVVSMTIYVPFRVHQIGVDALFAFAFLSNWWFAIQGTDYFLAAADSVSPVQHYWSLSIEEQFYFVWPALIFLVGLLMTRRTWTHSGRMKLLGAVMGFIVVASLGWSIYESSVSPAWAYFNTFARVWELGVGALLAISSGALGRIPMPAKSALSWTGIALIGASLFLIREGIAGFPAPWAILPVTGASLVIAAGVGVEPKFQAFLRNPVSTYIGDISYSLYLVHWPVIVIGGQLMAPGTRSAITVLTVSFGLAIASYHFVETPFRRANLEKWRSAVKEVKRRRYKPAPSSRYSGVAALGLLTVGLLVYTQRPDARGQADQYLTDAASIPSASSLPLPRFGPLLEALQNDISSALKADAWPSLDPSLESVITGPKVAAEVAPCSDQTASPNIDFCTWGSPSAGVRVVIVGDSVALGYSDSLRRIAMDSRGSIQVHTEAMLGCPFADDYIVNVGTTPIDVCPDRKQHAVDYINEFKPDIVVVANSYVPKHTMGSDTVLKPSTWSDSVHRIVDRFRGNTRKIVLLAPPPGDKSLVDCYGRRSSSPASCVDTVGKTWQSMARTEQGLATQIGGVWIDSQLWFCTPEGICPSFAGLTPTKSGPVHMVPAYGQKIAPVIDESIRAAGVW